MKTKTEQHNEYLSNGGTMTIDEWENDGRYDPSLEQPTNVIKYFIEHLETKKWFYPIWIPKYTTTFSKSKIRTGTSFSCGWTIDPQIAMALDSKEEAQKFIDIYNLSGTEITEHEFV